MPACPPRYSRAACPRATACLPACPPRYSRAAAVDELMGNVRSSVELYARAADLLLLLLTDVPAVAAVKPALPAQDQQRLFRYYAAIKLRQSACIAMLNADPQQQQQQRPL